MYVNEEIINGQEIKDNGTYYMSKCPNPNTKKYRKLLGCNGDYLNKDNWERGAYLIDFRYNQIKSSDKSYRNYFKNIDLNDFVNRWCLPENAIPINTVSAKLEFNGMPKSIEFDDTMMTVEEFCRAHETGNFLLETKAIVTNNCTQIIPVFNGKYYNNINCRKWGVVKAWRLPDIDNPQLDADEIKQAKKNAA